MEQQGPSLVAVAILVDSQALRGEVVQIVTELGWEHQVITLDDLKRERHATWDLIIIGVSGAVEDRTRLVRAVSGGADSRIVVISDDREPRHISTVLESGADDYVLTPFVKDELTARVRGLIDRARSLVDRRKRQVSFIYPMRTITFGPMHITFAPREWDVLIALLDADGRQLSPRELAEAVWGDPTQEAAAISTVSRVRSRLKTGQFHAISVHTHRGRGYSATIHRSVDRLPSAPHETMHSASSRQ